MKKIKVDEELVTDLLSMVKTAIYIKMWQTKVPRTTVEATTMLTKNTVAQNFQMVALQMSTITQLTEQASILQLTHNEINSKLDKIDQVYNGTVCQQQHPNPSKYKATRFLQGSPSQRHDNLVQLATCMVPTHPA